MKATEGLDESEFEIEAKRALAQTNETLVDRTLEEDGNLEEELGEMEQRDEVCE